MHKYIYFSSSITDSLTTHPAIHRSVIPEHSPRPLRRCFPSLPVNCSRINSSRNHDVRSSVAFDSEGDRTLNHSHYCTGRNHPFCRAKLTATSLNSSAELQHWQCDSDAEVASLWWSGKVHEPSDMMSGSSDSEPEPTCRCRELPCSNCGKS